MWLVLLVIPPCLAVLVYSIGTIRASRLYCLRADFAHLPADDKRLEQWLKAQPGVVAHTVHLKRESGSLRAWFIMTQNLRGSPPVPDLSHACDSLGYTPWSEWTSDRSDSM